MQATLKRPYTSEFHWLAFLLTGRRGQIIDAETVTEPRGDEAFFASWMNAWSRRVAIAKVLTGVRDELAASIRRTELNPIHAPALSLRELLMRQGATRSELEAALLVIDYFPRAVLVLRVFERVPAADCAVLLDASPDLVKRALNIGLLELAHNLVRVQTWKSDIAHPSVIHTEIQYA